MRRAARQGNKAPLPIRSRSTAYRNRRWFERETGHSIGAVQRFLRHPKLECMGATLDGIVPDDGAVFEAKFMLPWNFAEDVAADKHMARLQHID